MAIRALAAQVAAKAVGEGGDDLGENGEDYTPQERAALVAWHLAHGEGMRTADVEALTGLTWEGARVLMCKLSRVIPIMQVRGEWVVACLAEVEWQTG